MDFLSSSPEYPHYTAELHADDTAAEELPEQPLSESPARNVNHHQKEEAEEAARERNGKFVISSQASQYLPSSPNPNHPNPNPLFSSSPFQQRKRLSSHPQTPFYLIHGHGFLKRFKGGKENSPLKIGGGNFHSSSQTTLGDNNGLLLDKPQSPLPSSPAVASGSSKAQIETASKSPNDSVQPALTSIVVRNFKSFENTPIPSLKAKRQSLLGKRRRRFSFSDASQITPKNITSFRINDNPVGWTPSLETPKLKLPMRTPSSLLKRNPSSKTPCKPANGWSHLEDKQDHQFMENQMISIQSQPLFEDFDISSPQNPVEYNPLSSVSSPFRNWTTPTQTQKRGIVDNVTDEDMNFFASTLAAKQFDDDASSTTHLEDLIPADNNMVDDDMKFLQSTLAAKQFETMLSERDEEVHETRNQVAAVSQLDPLIDVSESQWEILENAASVKGSELDSFAPPNNEEIVADSEEDNERTPIDPLSQIKGWSQLDDLDVVGHNQGMYWMDGWMLKFVFSLLCICRKYGDASIYRVHDGKE